MEELLDDMRSFFEGLEAQQALSLEEVPNIFSNTEEIPSLQTWELEAIEQTPTTTKPD